MSTWPNRGGPPAAPAGGWKKKEPNGLTQANRPPRNPVRFSNLESREAAVSL
jgi:hypothetical protein